MFRGCPNSEKIPYLFRYLNFKSALESLFFSFCHKSQLKHKILLGGQETLKVPNNWKAMWRVDSIASCDLRQDDKRNLSHIYK